MKKLAFTILAFSAFARIASALSWESYVLGANCPGDEWHHVFGEHFKPYKASLFSAYYVNGGNPQGEFSMTSNWGTNYANRAFIQSSTNGYNDSYLFYLGAFFPDACTFHAPAWECFNTHLYGDYTDLNLLNAVDSVKMNEGMTRGIFQVLFSITDSATGDREVTTVGVLAELGPLYPEFFGPDNSPVINPPPLGPPSPPWGNPINLVWNGTPNLALSVSATTVASQAATNYAYVTNFVTDATGVGMVDFPWTNSSGFFRVTYTNSP